MIEVQGLRKRFGETQALDGVSFVAARGRITGILGPNGAGKSTALRILCTTLRADAGSASIDGVDIAQAPLTIRKAIGVLPHDANLYGNLTARENIAYYAALQGLGSAAAQAEAVERVIEKLGIEDIAHRRAKGFSHGQRVRIALARAMVHDPRALILDEPTNGLDVMATRALRDVVRERRDAGCCVLFSSHVMQEVAALCDHIVILARGVVTAAGSADDIRAATGCDDLEEAFVQAVGGASPAAAGSPADAA